MINNLLAIKVAARYLWSRKSHTAITAIAIAGMCGVAVATMAIVCVLSVFNGFNDAIQQRDSRITSDLKVQAAQGALIQNADSLAREIAAMPQVRAVTPAVNDEAVAYLEGRQLPVNILGVVPESYRKVTAIDSLTIVGEWTPQPQQVADMEAAEAIGEEEMAQIDDMADMEFDEDALFETEELSSADSVEADSLPVSPILVSSGVASNLQIPSVKDCGLWVLMPRRTASATFTDPASAFLLDSLAVTGIFSSQQPEFDAATVIMDIEVARRLLEYDTQANSLLIRVAPGVDAAKAKAEVGRKLGKAYMVTDRADSQTLQSRMAAIEKWITFLLLSFILLIASFNIISTLCMLIVEKRSNILTMCGYGASRPFIRGIFFWESVIVCLTGSLAGIVSGVALCLLQIHFGFITIPGNTAEMLMSVYPVSINPYDLLLIFALSAGVAALTGVVSGAFASRNTRIRDAA